MANRLSSAQVEQAWTAFQERQSADYVSRKCGLHWRTVERYRRLERWDERLAEISAKAQAAADYDLAAARGHSLRLLRAYKSKVEQALLKKAVSPDEVNAAELDRIVRTEMLLLGGPDSRTEVVANVSGRFSSMTDEELERFARDGTIPG
ncbi:MAG: hypothetical protein JNJ54_28515 [Myxococcaceae bacterium]|nr:hypothetical protein [Myxococcaceae bacterium]